MNDFYKEMKNYSACKSIALIRRIYQICFYIGLLGGVFIFLKLYGIKAEPLIYCLVAVAYVFSYAVLLVLRALEHLIGRVFYLEQELAARGVIDREPPQQNNN